MFDGIHFIFRFFYKLEVDSDIQLVIRISSYINKTNQISIAIVEELLISSFSEVQFDYKSHKTPDTVMLSNHSHFSVIHITHTYTSPPTHTYIYIHVTHSLSSLTLILII